MKGVNDITAYRERLAQNLHLNAKVLRVQVKIVIRDNNPTAVLEKKVMVVISHNNRWTDAENIAI